MRSRISLRWRFLLGFSFVMSLCFVGLHFTHRWQVRQQSGAFLRQADAAREAKTTQLEMDYLQRYLVSRPDDIDQRERFARLLTKKAKAPKELQECFLVLEDVLRRDPSRDEFRRFVVDYAITKVALIDEAKGHLLILMAKSPDDGVLEDQYAVCWWAQKDYKSAAEWYGKAYKHKPDLLNAYVGHSLMLREHFADPDAADKIVDLMVERNGTHFRAHLIRADYARKYGKPEMAQKSFELAKTYGPDELDVILFGADWAYGQVRQLQQTGEAAAAKVKVAEVRAELDRGRKLHPTSATIHLSRASLETEERDYSAAIENLKVGLAAIPDNIEILLSLVSNQIEHQNLADAENSLGQLEKLEYPINRVAYERGRVLMLKEAWLDAARALDIVRINAIDDAKLARSANLMLGRCYEQIGETDRRLEAFTRAIPEDTYDPLWYAALLGQAEAYAALGRPEDALRTYQKIADVYTGEWRKVAKFRLLMTLRKPEAERQWSPVEVAIDRAAAVPEHKDSTEVLLLRADLLQFQNQDDESRKIIDDLFAKRPKEVAVWIAKAGSILKAGSAADAVALLEKGRVELADPVELRIALATSVLDPKETALEAKLNKLTEGIEKYPKSAQRRLLRSLAESATASGNPTLAGQFWDRLVVGQPDDLAAQLIRFDRDLRASDEPGMDRVRAEIRRVDGDGGISTRVSRALYLIWKSQQAKSPEGLPEALALLEGVEKSRPGWSRIALGRAVILDRLGKPDAALAFYQKAYEQGESNPDVLRRLIEIHASKGNFAQANEVLSKMSDFDGGNPAAQRLAAEVSLKTDNLARAIERAAKAVPADSKEPSDWLWLGRLLWEAGDRDGAEKPFRQAVALKRGDPQGWLMLVYYLTAKKLPDAAKAEIEEMKKHVPAEQRSLVLAQCYGLVGALDLAKEWFQKARIEKPADPKVLYAEADFLTVTQQWAAARDAWERLIPLSTVSAEDKELAQKMFAICFAADPDYTTAKRAVSLLGMDAGGALINPNPNETLSQRRTRWLALSMQRDRASKLAAIKLMESDRIAMAPADRFLLAKLYTQVGDRKNVRTTMSELLRESEKNPLYAAFLNFYAAWLAEQKDFDEAAPLIAKIAKLQPDALLTAELQIRLLAGQKDLPAARGVLRRQAEKPDAPFGALAVVAERAGLLAEADDLMNRFVAANQDKRPEVILAHAEYYARTDRLKEAMGICERAWETCPPVTVARVSVAILAGRTLLEAKPWIEPMTKRIEAAIQKKWLTADAVQSESAFLKNLSGDYEGSIAMFRAQSELPIKNAADRGSRALALNNLAYLLAVHLHRHDEALIKIRDARALLGDLPELIDTEALILIDRGAEKDLVDARPLLEGLTASAPSGVAYFHLALLEKKLGKREELQLAWREAKRLKLKPSDLHPIERPEFDAMEREQR